jgi:hypothetical protein
MAQAEHDDTPNPSTLPAGAPAGGPPSDVPYDALRTLARLRREAAAEIERLLAFLDASEPDPDLEEDHTAEEEPDGEPSLGWTDKQAAKGDYGGHWLAGQDLEFDDSDDEDGADIEATNEDGGDINDEPHDEDSEAEPVLGSTETGAGSQLGWARGSSEMEGEDGAGPPPAKLAAARARYRPHTNVCVVSNGQRYDARTGARLPDRAPAAGIVVAMQHGGSLLLRGPGGRPYTLRKL